ncbi:MAG: hypothetical protein HY909_20370 [Deltaproteobacteria bacterium]|nr:hypothetical protein [Deltaproteobacteria bacterium]
MDRYFRVFKFVGQVFGMAGRNPRLFAPLGLNVAFAVPINIALVIAYMLTRESLPAVAWVLNAAGVVALYYTDYFCNGLAASMIYDEVTAGNATLGQGFRRTLRSAGGILIFATISGFFDLMASYAQERDDILGKILIGIVRAVWTTATYVVMPTMVIEGVGFGAAFKRSKELAENDPTGVGAGVIGMGLVTFLISLAGFGLAQFLFFTVGGVVGFLGLFTIVNVVWAVTGYLKITYFTCFYLWARECASRNAQDPRLAPAPLAAALA